MMTNELPVIPDEDDDFTPDVARKIIEHYQFLIGHLEGKVSELQDQLLDLTDPTLKSMRFDDGSFNMELGGEVVKRMAIMMTTWFREGGCKNYAEISINAIDPPFEQFLFYVQKRDGKSPGELADELRAELDEARAKLTSLSV